jgi:gliding motility-associated-like protein
MLLVKFIIIYLLFFFYTKSVAQSSAIQLSVTSTGTTCKSANGSLSITATGGTSPYTYIITNYQGNTTGIFLYLRAGEYDIEVTDAEGKKAYDKVSLSNLYDPPTGVSTIYKVPSGCTTLDATITLTGLGGTPPYSYSIDHTNFQKSNVFKNLPAGSYLAAVQDNNGCTNPYLWYDLVNIPEKCNIQQNGIHKSYFCDPFQSWLGLINVSGGAPPYQYSLDNINFQSNYDFFPVKAGLYTITVKDANDNKMQYAVALHDPCNSILNITGTVTPAQCGKNGTVKLIPINGTSPYQYSKDGIHFQTEDLFTELEAGTYNFVIKDGANNVISKEFKVESTCLSLATTIKKSTCGKTNGSIKVEAANGTGPYMYSVDGINFKTDNEFNNLSSGFYTVTVKDANSFLNSTTLLLEDVSGPVISSVSATAAECNKPGSIIIASDGLQPLQFSIDGSYQFQPAFSGLQSGTYNITVKDVNGCITTEAVTIPLSNNLEMVAGSDLLICEGETIKLNVVSTGNSFTWFPTEGLNSTSVLQPMASPKVTTTYEVTATLGACRTTGKITLTVNPAPTANAGRDTTICYGKDVQLLGSGGESFEWNPKTYLTNTNSANPIVTNPLKGVHAYSLKVKDANGCTSLNTSHVKVSVISTQVNAGRDTAVLANIPFKLKATDISNSGFTTYSWSPAIGLSNPSIADPVTIIDKDIIYTVTAITETGCVATDDVQLKVYKGVDIYVPTAFTPNSDGLNDILKAIPIGIKEFRSFNIYNRWGELIFMTTNPSKGWDGKYKGSVQDGGVYVFAAEGIDYHGIRVFKKGTFLLIR